MGLPTRSDIEGWIDAINVLSSAAEEYRAAAERVEVATDAHVQQMSAPGGTVWEGDAADAAQESSYADRGVVYRAADHMRDLAKVADQGAQNLNLARDRALDAISEAENDDFQVDSDLTVTDLRRYTDREIGLYEARKTKAQEHHGYIAMRAGALASADAEIGAKLNAGAAALTGMIPEQWTNTGRQPNGIIQSVDYKSAPPPKDTPSEANKRSNQIDAFRKVFGRDPVSSSDWDTAAALDPHSYDPKNNGVPPNIVVGKIKPEPGQGVVRTNLFIPGKEAWTPSGGNLGDNRGFSPTAGPEDSRVTIYTDYDNGIVVARQNPSIMNGQVQAGTPDIRVSQAPDGSVRIQYDAADPFSPGGQDVAKLTPWHVQGDLAIKPTPDGPIAGGRISDFPAVEIYSDRGASITELAKIMPQNTTQFGPLAGLALQQDIGQVALLNEFADGVSPTPMARVPPVIAPYPGVELGPVTSIPTVPVGR